MAARIVVGFLTRVSLATDLPAEAHVKRVTDLCQKAESLGGRLCAFGSQSVAFEFAEGDLEEAIFLALGEHAQARSEASPEAVVPWRMGIAEGEMVPVVHVGPLAGLGWGAPLVTAIALARIAQPGEVLVDPDMRAVARGDVLTSGSRVAEDAALGVRGLVIDPHHALRNEAAETIVTELVRPSLVGHQAALRQLLASDTPIGLVRADPGFGGTRLLAEVEAALSPARSLFLCSAGAEPLGALRRAFARSIAISGPGPIDALPAVHRRGLERLLSGDGVHVRLGAGLIARWVALEAPADASQRTGAVLVDDAMEVDDPSLDAVASAAELDAGTFRLIARLDANAPLPPPFRSLEPGPVVHLGPLPRPSAEEFVMSATQGSLSSETARRWARRGRFVPLGMIEALAEGLATGELAGFEGVPTPRIGADFRVLLDPKEWILRRFRFVRPSAKQVLRAVAILGVEVAALLVDELSTAIDAEKAADHIRELSRDGWLSAKPEGFYVLPSRTHREVILSEMPEHERSQWHDAASRVIERLGGKLATAEAARHAALSGNHQRAVDLALVAANASRQLELDAATEALLAFAGASSDDIPPLPAPTADFRLMSWIDALRATGDRDGAADRLQAIASLATGETSEALAALRDGVHLAEGAPAPARSRASLAYGIALAVTGRQTEALFSALEAFARAKESNEPRGAQACARFLARLSFAAGHPEASLEWQRVAEQQS